MPEYVLTPATLLRVSEQRRAGKRMGGDVSESGVGTRIISGQRWKTFKKRDAKLYFNRNAKLL